MEAYIAIGLKENLGLRQQDVSVQKSWAAVRQARALFFPTVQFNATYTRSVGGRNIEFPIGDLLNPVYTTLNQFTQSNAFPQVENATVQFLPDNFQETKLKIAYPLFNSDLRFNRRLREQLSFSQLAQRQAGAFELRYRITEAYLRYLQALEAEKIWLGARTVFTELRRFNESLVRNNVATRDVVATADYELSKTETELSLLRSRQNTARAYFNSLLHRDLQAEVTVDTTLLRTMVADYQPAPSVEQALANRLEFQALRAGQAAAETAVRLNEAARRLPDAYIGGELGFQGYGYTFNRDQAYALAQVGLTYDLFTGGQSKIKVQQAKLESETLRLQYDDLQQQIALQVTQASNDFEAARQAHATSQQGLKAAEEIFRIVNNKYRASQALLLEFLDAQNRVTTARLQSLLAWTDVLIKEASLRKAIGK